MALLLMNAGGPGLAAQVARGTVSAEETGQPVAGVLVLLLDARGVEVARTQSDPAGRYSVTAPAAGNYRLRFLIPGYRPLASSSFELAPGISREQPLRLIAAAPELLDTLVVEGRPVLALLAPFHRRRTFGFGTFLNREEIDEKRAADVSGVLTRLRVLDVLGDLGDGGGRRVGIRNRGGFAAGDLCPAAVYVNGAFAGVSGEVDIDLIVPLNAVEAMEVYRPGEVPIDFPLDGGGCGLVSLWSGPNVRDTTGVVRHLALAAHAGTRLGSEGVRDGRLGLSLSYTFTRGIEFYPSVNLHIGFPNTTPDPALAGWQAILALRARPMGPETPWYVGTGLSHVQLTGDLRADLTNDTGGQHHVLLTGLLLPGGPWRAYVEVHVLNPLAISSAQTSLFVGLARRFY